MTLHALLHGVALELDTQVDLYHVGGDRQSMIINPANGRHVYVDGPYSGGYFYVGVAQHLSLEEAVNHVSSQLKDCLS
jgi:hypothetical protein